MNGKEIRARREELGMSARAMGAKLGVEPATVLAWEREELFPTKRHLQAMAGLQREGAEKEGRSTNEGRRAPDAEEAGAGGAKGAGVGREEEGAVLEALADPAVWELLRKVLAYPELRRELESIAARYSDPAAERRAVRGQ